MKILIFDLETNGLLPDVSTIHCGVVLDPATSESIGYADQPDHKPLSALLTKLDEADVLVGHNILTFDIPVLEKLCGWRPRPGVVIRDTMVLAQLIWPHIKQSDYKKAERGRFPMNLCGRHSLKAWGIRLGERKGEYTGGWENWNPAMHEYMMQDAVVTAKLWATQEKELTVWDIPYLTDTPPPRKDCVVLEHRMAAICDAIQKHGFKFDTSKAVELVGQLQAARQALETDLQRIFPPLRVETVLVPKVNNKKLGYVKGVPFTKVKYIPFNPGSRQMVAGRLQQLGWKPQEYGKDGVPTLDDDILASLPYPEAQQLASYFTLQKRLGQISEGKEAWFRHARHGRIHGRIISNGAHTGRSTHSGPNMAQVPKVGSLYGAECRECFTADEGQVLVGADADGLELRTLAGYMANYDGGAFVETILNGRKEDGTDMHSRNAAILGCKRDVAKVYVYAMMYGAGDLKLGETLGYEGRKAMAAGKRSRAALMAGVPALGALIAAVQRATEQRGYLIGLDGRRLVARSANAALNTLLQSAGALIMKRATVTLVDTLAASGLQWGRDFAIVGYIHDEWQITTAPEYLTVVKETAAAAIQQAGLFYAFKCPTAGNADHGYTWADTH